MRMIQELQGVEGGVQTVLLRIPFGTEPHAEGGVEVNVLVRVPAIESETQVEAAAREMAKIALRDALSMFP